MAGVGSAPLQGGHAHVPFGGGDQDCHCFGVCVPGAHAVLPGLRPVVIGLVTLPQAHEVREVPASTVPTILIAERLPPATGPPQHG